MLRLVELEHELTDPRLAEPAAAAAVIDVTFADAPVDVHWVAFENYYGVYDGAAELAAD